MSVRTDNWAHGTGHVFARACHRHIAPAAVSRAGGRPSRSPVRQQMCSVDRIVRRVETTQHRRHQVANVCSLRLVATISADENVFRIRSWSSSSVASTRRSAWKRSTINRLWSTLPKAGPGSSLDGEPCNDSTDCDRFAFGSLRAVKSRASRKSRSVLRPALLLKRASALPLPRRSHHRRQCRGDRVITTVAEAPLQAKARDTEVRVL